MLAVVVFVSLFAGQVVDSCTVPCWVVPLTIVVAILPLLARFPALLLVAPDNPTSFAVGAVGPVPTAMYWNTLTFAAVHGCAQTESFLPALVPKNILFAVALSPFVTTRLSVCL